jgi:hypothetical protein
MPNEEVDPPPKPCIQYGMLQEALDKVFPSKGNPQMKNNDANVSCSSLIFHAAFQILHEINLCIELPYYFTKF